MDDEGLFREHPSQELLTRAKKYSMRDSLTRDEYEALMNLGPELVCPPSYDSQTFILGSYKGKQKERLLHLKRKINTWNDGNHRAVLMTDFSDGLNAMMKFKLIADYSDHIVGVCEHDKGGFQLELGMLVAMINHFDRCHLLKRSYPSSMEYEKYNWMLNMGVFEMFDHRQSLYQWEDVSEFKSQSTTVLENILR